jgi:signal transduction histidine kinase
MGTTVFRIAAAAACIVSAESMSRKAIDSAIYASIGLLAAAAAVLLSYTSLAGQFDNNVEDWLARLKPLDTSARRTAILAFDERTLMEHGGIRGLRRTLAAALERLASAPPNVVAVDLTLAEAGDPADDTMLERAFAHTRNLVLVCEMMPDGRHWQDPPPMFLRRAAAVGHDNALPGPYDNVNRRIALERVAGNSRRFALSLEALRLAIGARTIESSPTDLGVGPILIESRWDQGRPMRVHYRDSVLTPHVAIADLLRDPSAASSLVGKVVFVGVTALSLSPDRLFTPLSTERPLPGVEFHAQAFETMASGEFLYDAPLMWPVLWALTGAAAIALLFSLSPPRWTYPASVAVVVVLHLIPWLAFRENMILPASTPIATAWSAFLGAFSYRFFVVRRRLEVSEQTSDRYQKAFRFVAHELRTPLTAIQGSGELLTRYNLPEEKRRQLAETIQNESRRLAKMIGTFLDVEKLSAGQMELRSERLAVVDLIGPVIERARPLAERKQIEILHEVDNGIKLWVDRELMEYVVYNLLTNAIKYSPPGKQVLIAAAKRRDSVTLTVRDNGIGMDEDDLKHLFTRFFRSQRAVQSGETGTGIGLVIVEQIVTQHGGRIEVTSKPGVGSAFTVLLPQAR